MSKLSDLKQHVQSLEEIRDIIDAMKNLSIVEINKVMRFLLTQKKVVETIENTAKDFFSFHTTDRSFFPVRSEEICIVIGSERGFCGGFNEILLGAAHKNLQSIPIIAIGKKLQSKLKPHHKVLEMLDGPNTLEEIDTIVNSIIEMLSGYMEYNWIIAFNEDTGTHIEQRFIRPFHLLELMERSTFSSEPVMNMEPKRFAVQLLDQYIFAMIYHAFYTSFAAENKQRLRHMDGAVSRIDKNLEQFHLRLNRLRQEEITEEIEVLLLNVEESKVQ